MYTQGLECYITNVICMLFLGNVFEHYCCYIQVGGGSYNYQAIVIIFIIVILSFSYFLLMLILKLTGPLKMVPANIDFTSRGTSLILSGGL